MIKSSKTKPRQARAAALVVVAFTLVVTLTGCGVVQETVDGMMTPYEPTNESPPTNDDEAEMPSGSILVEVSIDSDASTASNVQIDIDARQDAQSVSLDIVDTPYQREFTVPGDMPFPLKGTRVEAHAIDGATYVTCVISYNGKEVATHRAEGDQASAVCEKELTIGPQ